VVALGLAEQAQYAGLFATIADMKLNLRGVSITGAVLLVVLSSGSLWWTQAVQKPDRVFQDMLANNLSTNGVTRTVVQQGQGLQVTQYTQLSFGQQPTAHALTVFKQNRSMLATEQISSPQQDFVRYQQINVPSRTTGKPINASSVLGKWAQLRTGETVSGQLSSGLFDQSVLGVLPMANLAADKRAQLLQFIQSQKVFSYTNDDVKKTTQNGRPVFVYSVHIHTEAYIELMRRFELLMGGTAYASLSPASYKNAAPIAVELSVDARSHQLSQLYESSLKRTERYQGFGISDASKPPTATITTAELAQRLGALQQ
jgi:hypothetical protein